MNWDAIGALGEVIGALVVVITLLYLAVQTRQTRLAIENGGSIATNEAHSRFRLALMENPDLVAVLAKANDGAELNERELVQFRALATELFFACVIGSLTGTEGAPRAELEYLTDFMKLNPSVTAEWRRQHHMVSKVAPQYCAQIDYFLEHNGDA